MQPVSRSVRKRRIRISTWIAFAVLVLALTGVDLMFYFWPFRYREVHPLLEKTFQSRVDVTRYHRTYFPHPGFVADGVTLYRHGDTRIPPLATMERMEVVGTWTNLLFHPHELYQIRLEGLQVRIPPKGTEARGMDFGGGMTQQSQQKMVIETIVADGSTLDLLRKGQPPLRFAIPALQIHNVRQNEPFQFFARVRIPGPQGMVEVNGSLGPLRRGDYGETPLEGTYSLEEANLSLVDHIAGHASATGHYRGTLKAVQVDGKVTIPDFRAGSAHTVRLDGVYRLVVNGQSGDVQIEHAVVKTGDDTITASGSVAGSPKTVDVTFQGQDCRVGELLDLVEGATPSVEGLVSFRARAQFRQGREPFLERLRLVGEAELSQLRLVSSGKQEKVNAFSARESKSSGGHAPGDTAEVSGQAHTRFVNGMAYFPDIAVELPGAAAHLSGTFNLLSTQVHLAGKVELQRTVSHAVTGWKSVLLAPLDPFFRHGRVGAVVSVAVTGTANHPRVGEDVLHNK